MITRINWARARSALAALLTSGSLALVPGAPAQATPGDGTESIRGFLAEHGADRAAQDRLLADYRAGGVWDSMRSSARPVSTRGFAAMDGRHLPRRIDCGHPGGDA